MAVSGILLIAAIVSLSLYGLKPGIDFTGGALMQEQFQGSVPAAPDIEQVISDAGTAGAQVQTASGNVVNIRTSPIDSDQHNKILDALKAKFGDITEQQYTSIGPVIGKELRSSAIWMLVLVSLFIVFYIAFAFRHVTRPVSSWRFGWAAIVALLHDLVIVLGVFSLLGHFLGVEVDTLFVTAMLTVLGFSVHDTIVVFDRIRENLRLRAGTSLPEIINSSINQTLIRSLNTSLTVAFVLLAMLLFGGVTIRYFVLALLVGIIAGTYSSIYIASPILIIWHNRDLRRRK